MKRTRLAGVFLALLAATTPAGAAVDSSVPAAAGRSYRPGELLVRFAPRAAAARRAGALATVAGSVARALPRIGWHVVRTPLPVEAAIRRLRVASAVAEVEPNYLARIQGLTPDDRCFVGCLSTRQWNIGAVNAQLGWAAYPGRFYTATEKRTLPPVKIAVLDTKIDHTMIDWINAGGEGVEAYDAARGGQLAMADAKDFVPASQQPGNAAYHGSFVAGILGASANNVADIAGVGYRAQVMPVAVVDGAGYADAARVADGILWASARGARVINMSLGLTEDSSPVQDAINLATQGGALVVAAAGNNANDRPFYPAWYDNVVAVGALDEADRPGGCTNHSSHTSVSAPGVGIVSLDPSSPNHLSVTPCGTSTATPHVSALAALLFSQDPARTPAQVRDIIERTADDDRFFTGRDDYYGYGRINFERALRFGQGPSVNRVRASFPKATGGISRATAEAVVTAPRAIRAAEYFVDAPVAPGYGRPMSAADGAFDETTESLTADIAVDLDSVATGVHRLYVRAWDGTTWGPAAVGVLIVDRTPPRITELTATPTTIAVAGQGTQISFKVGDDYGTAGTYTLKVVQRIGISRTVYESEPKPIAIPGTVRATWAPDPTDVGQHEITVTVRDEAGNPATAMATTFVV